MGDNASWKPLWGGDKLISMTQQAHSAWHTLSILYVLVLIILWESTLYNLNYDIFLIPQWQDSNMDHHLRKYIDKLSHMTDYKKHLSFSDAKYSVVYLWTNNLKESRIPAPSHHPQQGNKAIQTECQFYEEPGPQRNQRTKHRCSLASCLLVGGDFRQLDRTSLFICGATEFNHAKVWPYLSK